MKELANKQMMVINNAYKILKDAVSRDLYDKQRVELTAPKKAVFEIKIDSKLFDGVIRELFKSQSFPQGNYPSAQ